MVEPSDPDVAAAVEDHLLPGEGVTVAVRASDAVVAVTSRRLMVKVHRRLALAVPLDALRRIQLDVERDRPATLVIVPLDPVEEAQVLTIPGQEIERVAQAVAVIGRQFANAM